MTSKEGLKAGLDKGIEYLKSKGCREIIIFGSFVDGSFNEHSDIDIAVSGISPIEFFRAVVEVPDIVGHRVDLVFLGHIPKELESIIRSEGDAVFANT